MKKPDQKLAAKHATIILVLPIVLNLLLHVTPAATEPSQINSNDGWHSAEVADISDSKYYPAVKKAIDEARSEIYVAMYLISLDPYDRSSPVYELVSALISAHKRGVRVKVILDQSADFVEGRNKRGAVTTGKNAWSFKTLKEAEVDVLYDDPIIYMHTKAIVIDKEIVIIGSSNWSYPALIKNFESNTLIRSKELAAKYIKNFENIKIADKEDASDIEAYVPLSWRFLEKGDLAARMMENHDERAMDLYLTCLKEFDGNNQGKIIIDYNKMAAYLGLNKDMTKEEYRRQITRTLRKLEETYSLIKFEPNYAKDAAVTLLDYENPSKPYELPKEWYFRIPGEFWKYDWIRNLPMRAKLCYLINLAMVSISNAAPWWSSSRETLAKRFNLKVRLISEGMQELRRINLIDVLYDDTKGDSFDSRSAKSYKILPLYDPAWLEGEWNRLKSAYGSESLERAREYAKTVYKENDPQAVEDIINMTNVVGEDKIKKAFVIVAQKHPDNPKRCYAYVRGILNQLQKNKEL